MQSANSGDVNIHRVPEVTHEGAEDPLARDLKGGAEGHGQEGHTQVSTGQGDQEIVVHMSQPSVEDHADNHKNVVDNCHDDDDDKDDTLGDEQGHVQVYLSFLTVRGVV